TARACGGGRRQDRIKSHLRNSPVQKGKKMKNTNRRNTNSLASRVALTSVFATKGFALLTSAPRAAAAGNPNPGVIPLNATFNEKTYGERGVAWWQWALSIPADRNPFRDRTGQFCAENQSGPVWFRT